MQTEGNILLPMLSIREVAALCCVSTITIRRWWAAGVLPAPLLIGARRRWRAETIYAWLDAGCPPQSAEKNEREPEPQEA